MEGEERRDSALDLARYHDSLSLNQSVPQVRELHVGHGQFMHQLP